MRCEIVTKEQFISKIIHNNFIEITPKALLQ